MVELVAMMPLADAKEDIEGENGLVDGGKKIAPNMTDITIPIDGIDLIGILRRNSSLFSTNFYVLNRWQNEKQHVNKQYK